MEDGPQTEHYPNDNTDWLLAQGIVDERLKTSLEQSALAADNLEPTDKFHRLLELADQAGALEERLQYGVRYHLYEHILAMPQMETNPYINLYVRELQLAGLKHDYSLVASAFREDPAAYSAHRQETLERIEMNTTAALAVTSQYPGLQGTNSELYRRALTTVRRLQKYPGSKRQFKD